LTADALKIYPDSNKLYVWQRIIYLVCVNPDIKIDINQLSELYLRGPPATAFMRTGPGGTISGAAIFHSQLNGYDTVLDAAKGGAIDNVLISGTEVNAPEQQSHRPYVPVPEERPNAEAPAVATDQPTETMPLFAPNGGSYAIEESTVETSRPLFDTTQGGSYGGALIRNSRISVTRAARNDGQSMNSHQYPLRLLGKAIKNRDGFFNNYYSVDAGNEPEHFTLGLKGGGLLDFVVQQDQMLVSVPLVSIDGFVVRTVNRPRGRLVVITSQLTANPQLQINYAWYLQNWSQQ
jgi:hypothetical protein